MPDKKESPIESRKAAMDILAALEKSDELLDTIIDRFSHEHTALSPQDRRLANAIVFGVLRWRRRLDWIIRQYATIAPARISPSIRNILRIALFQIIFLDRVPDFAAVDTAVEMSKKLVSVKASRFVNGLLRNTVRKLPPDIHSILPDDPVAALAISQSFPDWLIHRWINRFGIEETTRLCGAMNQIPPVTIRTNTLKIGRKALMEVLKHECATIYETEYAPGGLSFFSPAKPIDQLSGFSGGLFQVQDEAAQIISHMLCPHPNETILDACAGLGGKTGHIAQLMKNTGKILAIDKDNEKLAKLAGEMKRLQVSNVKVRQMTLDMENHQQLPEFFDRVLLDAPCSGLGVIRRNPDIKWAINKKDLTRFAKRQHAYLDMLSRNVAPGGLLLYSVCTTEPEETDAVIEIFLKNHPEFKMLSDKSDLPVSLQTIVNDSGIFKSLPHIHPMDGFFAARLKRHS